MNYIRQWKALPEYGITTMNVKFKNMRAKKAVGKILFLFLFGFCIIVLG